MGRCLPCLVSWLGGWVFIRLACRAVGCSPGRFAVPPVAYLVGLAGRRLLARSVSRVAGCLSGRFAGCLPGRSAGCWPAGLADCWLLARLASRGPAVHPAGLPGHWLLARSACCVAGWSAVPLAAHLTGWSATGGSPGQPAMPPTGHAVGWSAGPRAAHRLAGRPPGLPAAHPAASLPACQLSARPACRPPASRPAARPACQPPTGWRPTGWHPNLPVAAVVRSRLGGGGACSVAALPGRCSGERLDSRRHGWRCFAVVLPAVPPGETTRVRRARAVCGCSGLPCCGLAGWGRGWRIQGMAGVPPSCTGRPAACQARKPPMRSVAWGRPTRLRSRAAKLEA